VTTQINLHPSADVIVNTHLSLLHAGRTKTFKAVNQYYGIAKAEVGILTILFNGSEYKPAS
jgi:hypothetical protein